MAFQGPLVGWVADHRRHHAYTDRDGDPHTPHGASGRVLATWRGALHAHAGWLFRHDPTDADRYARDVLADADLRRISALFPLWCVLSLALPFGAGWLLGGSLGAAGSALLWAGVVRIAVLHQVTWSINSLCHLVGRRPHATKDHSTNLALLSVVSMGESFHNNHHAFPGRPATVWTEGSGTPRPCSSRSSDGWGGPPTCTAAIAGPRRPPVGLASSVDGMALRRYSELRGRRMRLDEAVLERFVMSRPGFQYLRHVAPRIDRVVIPRTGGRLSSAGRDKVGLLTTVGARSGERRTQPLVFVDDGDGLLAIGSNYGQAPHPAWSHNLLAHPECEVEFRGPPTPHRAELLTGPDRDRAWATAVDFYAGYANYAAACAPREIRLFRLRPTAA